MNRRRKFDPEQVAAGLPATAAPPAATSSSIVAPTFLFRFSAPCTRTAAAWSASGVSLGEEYTLPWFAELDEGLRFADVRAAWNDGGLFFSVRVTGKKQSPWCREARIEDSDGFHIWIDTRDTHSIHRAGRFCHQFAFLPGGGGSRLDEPVAEQLIIARARENAKPVRPGVLKARAEKRIDGYLLEAHIPAAALTGFDPAEHPRLGFMYAVYDREFGEQTFSVGSEFPYRDDPSLWGTLELAR